MMTLAVTDGLVLRLETDEGLTTSSGVVEGWLDLSGFGNHLIGYGDPTFGNVLTPSGLPAIDFDGAGDKLERIADLSGLPAGSADRTVFFVVDYVDPNGVTSGFAYGDGASNQTFGTTTTTTGALMVQAYGGSNDQPTTTDGLAGGFLIQSAVLSGNVLDHYRDGVLIGTDTHAFATDAQKITLGAEIGGLGYSDLDVAAVLVFDRALTEAERGEVESYLQQKYIAPSTGNAAPIAVGDIGGLIVGGTTTVGILANDIDDGPLDGGSVTILSGPSNGTIDAIDPATGQVTYTHGGGATTTDSFSYALTDADGATSAPATVALDIDTLPALSMDGFVDELVLTREDLAGGSPFFLPISMAFLPDNRMLLLSKDGEIRIVDPESGQDNIFMQLTNINSGNERGLLDITLDPDFASNGYFYLFYTPGSPQNARVSRFTFEEDSGGLTSSASLSSEVVIWEDTDGYLSCCHYGGGLDFGIDGKLWLSTSDKFQVTTPGEGPAGGVDLPLLLESSSGKVVRFNKDGSIPDGSDGWPANPFVDGPGGADDSIWAYGLRNPFRARWDAEYGHFYIGEVGGNQKNLAHEDLHLANLDQPGVFYGWPFYEGTTDTYVNGGESSLDPAAFPQPDGDLGDPANGDLYSSPIFSIPHEGTGRSFTGGEVYRGDMFPSEWNGVYFYGDYTQDYIRYLRLDATGTQVLGDYAFKPSVALPGATNEVVSIAVGADGALYYAMIGSGEVRRITFDANAAPEITGVSVTPLEGELPLEVTFSALVTDAEGDPMTYVLNFGNGVVLTGDVPADGIVTASQAYQNDGFYDISLSVSDPEHTVLSQVFQIAAGDVNFAPVIADAASNSIFGGVEVTEITFSASVTDADGDPLTFTWHFGDGTSATGTVGADGIAAASHVYVSEGAFEAYLEVSDGTDLTVSERLPIQIGPSDQVPVTSGLVLLLQSDIKIGLGTGSTVVSWLDGSGQGNNLFAKGDPQLVESQTPTGEPAIVFDGAGDLLERVNATDTIFNLPVGSADRTMFFVVDYVDPEGVSAGLAYGDGQSNQTFGLVTEGDGELGVQGYGLSYDFGSGQDGVAGGFLVQSVVLQDNVTSHYRDGALIDSDTHLFATDLQRLVIGAEIRGKGEAQMAVSAVLIYDRALGETERLLVEDFLQNRYIGATTQVAPVAGNDAATTNEAIGVLVDVLANDTDANGDAISIASVGLPAHGAAAIDDQGTADPSDDLVLYTPDPGFVGQDSFTYTISDGQGGTDEGLVSVDVLTPTVNNAPQATDDFATTLDGLAVAVDVLVNDGDPDGDPLSITSITTAANGTVTIDDGGTPLDGSDDLIVYTPNAGFVGQDGFTYTISDGKDGTDVGGVIVSVEPRPAGVPITAGLVAAYEAGENVLLGTGSTVQGWLDGSGLGNDLYAKGDPTLSQGATPSGQAAIVFDGAGDLLERVAANDTLTSFASGSADRTMFLVVDYVDPQGVSAGLAYGDGQWNQTFGLVAEGDGELGVQGYASRYDFGSGQDGVAGGFLVQSVVLQDNVTSHYRDGALIDTDTNTFATDLQRLVIGAEIRDKGEAQMAVSAAFIYNRALSATERAEVESYLQDKYMTPSTTDNTAPTATADAFTFVEDTVLAGNVLVDNGSGADIDPDGDPLTASLVTNAANGSVALAANGDFTYTPDANYDGADSFAYEISDGRGGKAQATVTLAGQPVDDPAVAVDDFYATALDTALVAFAETGVLANDVDIDGPAPANAQLVTNTTNGSLSLAGDGSFTYTPNAGFAGQDAFTYAIDGGDVATATITVGAPPTTGPIAAGLVARFESSDGVSADAAGVVSGWEDLSGRGNHLSAGGDPTLVAAGTPTGEAAIAFDGAGDLLQRIGATDPLSGLVPGNGDRTLFFVVDYVDPEGIAAGFAYGDGAQDEAFGAVVHSTGNLMVQGWGSAEDVRSKTNGVEGGFLVQAVVLDEGFVFHYHDGTLIDSRAEGFATDIQKMVIGGEIAGLGEAQMNVAAALVYDRALAAEELTDVSAFLREKYISADLVA